MNKSQKFVKYVNEIIQKKICETQVASRYQRRTGMHLDVPDPPSNSARYFLASPEKLNFLQYLPGEVVFDQFLATR